MASLAGLAASRPIEAKTIAARWRLLGRRTDHTLFTRLWLWAAAEYDLVDPDEVLSALIDSADLLWGEEFEAEVLRFIRLGTHRGRIRLQAKLGATVMRTPP